MKLREKNLDDSGSTIEDDHSMYSCAESLSQSPDIKADEVRFDYNKEKKEKERFIYVILY